jgi:BMFP domain-containing protein YqiC
LIARQSPEAQAIIRLLIEQNAQLKKRIEALEARLSKTSRNLSKPPSSEHPHTNPEPQKKTKSQCKRG